MKKNLLISIKLTALLIIILGGIYPLLIAGIGKFTPGSGNGETIKINNRVVGYANLGQKFTDDKYFWGRPSAVDYNAAGSGGSNKGPFNPEYLATVQQRIDSFMAHNPSVDKSQLPSEMVTASGSGLDPDISIAGAMIQVDRIARARQMQPAIIRSLIDQYTEPALLHIAGPSRINVLKLNVALDNLSKK